MRIDVISIFPDYLAPLALSLLGRARADELLALHTHDLRAWTHDRHHTVDDAPYGGGAGMVMKPQPWGEAIDDLLAARAGPGNPDSGPRLIVPSPSGTPFHQATAERLSNAPWLIFACGRYEGIDQRVVDHYSGRMAVEEISIGDFIVGGGEVAAMVMIESIVRLVPGVLGNPESLAEESHRTGEAGGLLEYPVYTKPREWRDLAVPDVLLSGHHGQVAAWRGEQAVRRTLHRRPDLAHHSSTLDATAVAAGLDAVELRLAVLSDAAELLTLQLACWVSEAQINGALLLPPLTESLSDVQAGIGQWTTWVLRTAGRLVGSARARLEGDVYQVGRLMVAPDLQGRGLGRLLLQHAEAAAPPQARSFSLFTGAKSVGNLRRYRKAGYRVSDEPMLDATGSPDPGVLRLTKPRRR